MKTRVAASAALAALLIASGAAAQQQDYSKVQIQTIPVAGNVYMLMGAGGNIAVLSGEDGVLMVDDQFAPLSDKITAAIKAISDKPIRFVLNTHWHFDHTGGNENFGKMGATIVAHENVRKLMSEDQFIQAFNMPIKAAPEIALPAITFTASATFHMNGETVRVEHVPPAHTAGDSIVHFVSADAIHGGDTLFSGMYPFIDVQNGGSIDGMIGAVDRILALADEGTKIIPGHGPLMSKADVARYRTMLTTARDRVAAAIAEKKSAEEIAAADPLADLDETWGKGFLAAPQFLKIVHQSLSR